MTGIPWTGSVASMASTPIWDHIVARMVDSGFAPAREWCQAALDDLLEWEYKANVAMISGGGPFHTIWSRSEKA